MLFNPSGLEGLNTMFPTYVNPNEDTLAAGIVPQPFTPQEHNPTIQSSQATDDISWAGGEGWSEEEFGGPGWTYGGGENSDTGGSLSYTFNGGGGGGSTGGGGGSAPVLNTRMPLNRIPSGSVYAPDLSAYNDSSLFNYTGPGGASEYTYGQNLPYQGAGYDIWGSPTDVANPYFWGQFANTATTGAATGPADAAINMPAVEMPAGVPSTNTTSSVPNTNINTGGGVGAGGGRVNQGSEYETGPVYATAEDAMAAGDYWSAYRKDHARWRAENPNAGTYDYPGNPALGIRSDANQLQAMGGGRNLSEAQINQIRADEHRMQQGQLGNVSANSGLEWPKGDNLVGNEAWGQPGILSAFSENDAGMVDARRNFLFNNDLDLGRPGDASYEEFVPTYGVQTQDSIDRGNRAIDAAGGSMDIPDYGPMFQAEADRLMANLTEEELRDGLFLEPQLKIVDGKVVGKMGIPDVFLQDKSPIEPRSTLFDDPFGEFDPDNRYREPDRGDNFIWQDKFGEYHNQWDDMGLETYIPGSYDEDFMSGKSATEAQEEFYNSQQVENEKAAEATRLRDIEARAKQEKEIKDRMEARDAVLAEQQRQEQIRQNEESARQLLAAQAAAQAKAKAEAEAKAKAAAEAEAKAAAAAAAAASAVAAAQAAAQAQEYETGPVDTPNIFTSTPEPSSFSNYNDDYSNYTNSYFSGGFW